MGVEVEVTFCWIGGIADIRGHPSGSGGWITEAGKTFKGGEEGGGVKIRNKYPTNFCRIRRILFFPEKLGRLIKRKYSVLMKSILM